MSEIYTKRGKLSAYGLRCGYIERRELADKRVTLFNEHDIYLVNVTNLSNFYQKFRNKSDFCIKPKILTLIV